MEAIYTLKETCLILKSSRAQVLRWIYSGQVNAFKIGGGRCWRTRERDLNKFINCPARAADRRRMMAKYNPCKLDGPGSGAGGKEDLYSPNCANAKRVRLQLKKEAAAKKKGKRPKK